MKRFEFTEHTADIGIRVFATTENELFQNAGEGLLYFLFGRLTRLSNDSMHKLTLTAARLDELMVAWLNELLSLYGAEGFVANEFLVSLAQNSDARTLSAQLNGTQVMTQRIKPIREIKGATYHNLKIEPTKAGYVAEIIFDV